MFDLYRSASKSQRATNTGAPLTIRDVHDTITSKAHRKTVREVRKLAKKERRLNAKLDAIADDPMRYAKRARMMNDASGLEDARAELKKHHLPGVTFGGTFERRKKAKLTAHSGHVCLDLDHVEDAPSVRDSAMAIQSTALAFVSPSGDGVKCVVAVDPVPTDDAGHKAAYAAVAAAYEVVTQGKLDDAGSDVTRLCFLSHDPDATIRDEPARVTWTMPEPQPDPEPEAVFRTESAGVGSQRGYAHSGKLDAGARSLIDKWTAEVARASEGVRNNTLNSGGLVISGLVKAGRAPMSVLDELDAIAMAGGLTKEEVAATHHQYWNAAEPKESRPRPQRHALLQRSERTETYVMASEDFNDDSEVIVHKPFVREPVPEPQPAKKSKSKKKKSKKSKRTQDEIRQAAREATVAFINPSAYSPADVPKVVDDAPLEQADEGSAEQPDYFTEREAVKDWTPNRYCRTCENSFWCDLSLPEERQWRLCTMCEGRVQRAKHGDAGRLESEYSTTPVGQTFEGDPDGVWKITYHYDDILKEPA